MLNKAEYWLGLCDNDLKAAKAMLEANQFLWTGFICHLIVEKAIKAIIASKTCEIPPRLHKLSRLAEIGDIYDELDKDQQELLDILTPLQIEGRYPEYKEKVSAKLTKSYCRQLLTHTEEFVCWTKQRLGSLPQNTQAE